MSERAMRLLMAIEHFVDEMAPAKEFRRDEGVSRARVGLKNELDLAFPDLAPDKLAPFESSTAQPPPPPEPVYRTAEELVTAINDCLSDVTSRKSIYAAVSRYRPESKAEERWNWLQDKHANLYYSWIVCKWTCCEGGRYTQGDTPEAAVDAAMDAGIKAKSNTGYP